MGRGGGKRTGKTRINVHAVGEGKGSASAGFIRKQCGSWEMERRLKVR
jgi:hypothetical protein